MKMIIRGFALAIVGFVVSLVYVNYAIVDFHETQLIYATQNAMFTTQEAEKHYVVDCEYQDNPIKVFDDEEAYFEDFKANFLKQITSKNTTFDFTLLNADLEKGLLSVEIVEHYFNVLGQPKTTTIQKTSIVNVLGYE